MNMHTHFQKKWTKQFGLIYTIFLTVIAAALNYLSKTSALKSISALLQLLILLFIIASLYVPVILIRKYEKWSMEDFGIVFNLRTIVVSVIIVIPIIIMLILLSIPKNFSILSIITRVGEELFYRGFLYQYLYISFMNKKHPVIGAVFFSSLFFALVHTQTFFPTSQQTILEIFIFAVLFAVMRYYTKSILTPVLIHCIADGGILGGIMGAIIYGLMYRSKKMVPAGKPAL